jgi:hypothetical protein
LRTLISSIPMRRSPASTSRRASASAITRSQIEPTARHVVRISCATAVFEVLTASHAHWSSNAVVNHEPWRAHGTAATITPWRLHSTRGASAST